MTCDLHRERIALRSYGELDPDEARALEEHLASCEACARFAADLDATFGELRELRAEPAVPRPIASAPAPRRAAVLPWLVGFAAGVVVTLLVRAGPGAATSGEGPERRSADAAPVVEPAPGPAWVESAASPPLASTGGSLAAIGAYLERR